MVRQYLRLAVAGGLGLLLLQLDVVHPRAEQLHRHLPVLELAALLRAEDADARGLVKEVHRRFDLIFYLFIFVFECMCRGGTGGREVVGSFIQSRKIAVANSGGNDQHRWQSQSCR